MPVTTMTTTQAKKRYIDGCEKIDIDKKVDDQQKEVADGTTSSKEEPVQQKPTQQRIRFNLWLWRYGFEKLMLWMKEKATEIRTVDVGAELWNQFEPEQVTKVLEAISELPNLENIQFSLRESLGLTSGGLSISVLYELMTKAKGLEKLVLKDIELQGTHEEWTALAKVFQSHPSLLHLRLENYKFEDGSRCSRLADLIPALGANQTLRILEIDAEELRSSIVVEEEKVTSSSGGGGGDTSGGSINKEKKEEKSQVKGGTMTESQIATTNKTKTTKKKNATNHYDSRDPPEPAPLPVTFLASLLGETKSLEVVKLCGLPINDDHIYQLLLKKEESTTNNNTEVSSRHNNNKTLQEILLWKTEITDIGAKDLSRILSLYPSIKKVNLNDNPLLSAMGCQSIFDSLVSSSTSTTTTVTTTRQTVGIEELYLGCLRGEMNDQVRTSLLRMISKNQTLKKLEIQFSWPLEATVETLVKFEIALGDAINNRSSPVLDYVRLYNDDDGVVVQQQRQQQGNNSPYSSSYSHHQQQAQQKESSNGNNINNKMGLLWTTSWERPTTLLLSDDEEEEFDDEEEEVKNERKARKSRKISC